MPSSFIVPTGNPIALPRQLRETALAGAAIVVIGSLSGQFLDGQPLMIMLASMGPSVMILASVPSSPMAQDWPVVGGHLVSGAIGVGCSHLPLDHWIVAGLAVGLSTFAMHALRCLHPPGGATTLVAALSGGSQAMSPQFLLTPLALNLAILLCLSKLLRGWNGKRRLAGANPPRETRDPPPLERTGISREDLSLALRGIGSFVDVREAQLGELFNLATAVAAQRKLGDLTAVDLMSKDLVTVEGNTEIGHAWKLLMQERVKALPVVDRSRQVIGIVTLTDLVRQAAGIAIPQSGHLTESPADGQHRNRLIVGQVMRHPVATLKASAPVAQLALVMTERNVHQIPIVDASNRLVGLVTETDVIAALYRSLPGGMSQPSDVDRAAMP